MRMLFVFYLSHLFFSPFSSFLTSPWLIKDFYISFYLWYCFTSYNSFKIVVILGFTIFIINLSQSTLKMLFTALHIMLETSNNILAFLYVPLLCRIVICKKYHIHCYYTCFNLYIYIYILDIFLNDKSYLLFLSTHVQCLAFFIPLCRFTFPFAVIYFLPEWLLSTFCEFWSVVMNTFSLLLFFWECLYVFSICVISILDMYVCFWGFGFFGGGCFYFPSAF